MAVFKFRVEKPGGFDEHHVCYRSRIPLESLGPMVFGAETRNYDDALDHDAKCIKSLDTHKYVDEVNGTWVKSFTKLTV